VKQPEDVWNEHGQKKERRGKIKQNKVKSRKN